MPFVAPPAPGDLAIASASRVVIQAGDARLVVGPAGAAADAARLRTVRLGAPGFDLESRILAVPTTPGVGTSNVTGAHVALGSVSLERMAAVVPVASGGTGSAGFGPGELLFGAADGTVTSHPAVALSNSALALQGGVELQPPDGDPGGPIALAASNGQLVALFGDSTAHVIGGMTAGATPPEIADLAVARAGESATVSFHARDAGGDVRAVHVAWFATAPAGVAPADVLLHTLAAGAGAHGTTPLGCAEVETDSYYGSANAFGSLAVTGLPPATVYFAAVAEDGPGATSALATASADP